MKQKITLLFAALAMLSPQLSTAFAATTIDPFDKYAWGGSFGWLDWTGGTFSYINYKYNMP